MANGVHKSIHSMMKSYLLFLLATTCHLSLAFAPSALRHHNFHHSLHVKLETNRRSLSTTTTGVSSSLHQRRRNCILSSTDKDMNEIWMPPIRRIMGGIASLGVLETVYLTYNKLFEVETTLFCGTDGTGSCSSVLNGPYSYVPFTEIPLAALGLVAYTFVLGLSLFPLLSDGEQEAVDDTTNRILLTAATTAMGTFSIFLLTLLFGVLETGCPYCEFSAGCSISLAMLTWIGGCPPSIKQGVQTAASSFLATCTVALLLFIAGGDYDALTTSKYLASALSGSTNQQEQQLVARAPPPISTESSPRAISLAKDLQSLDAKMFGAYWCGHCYDQKETLGKQAFSRIPYIECSKDGAQSQTKLCKSKDVPGYPTWEINGKLYPGEQELDELEEIVATLKKASSN
eukprot:scaffold3267_cov140-Cylindrotheca_fusiformis.AAC.4